MELQVEGRVELSTYLNISQWEALRNGLFQMGEVLKWKNYQGQTCPTKILCCYCSVIKKLWPFGIFFFFVFILNFVFFKHMFFKIKIEEASFFLFLKKYINFLDQPTKNAFHCFCLKKKTQKKHGVKTIPTRLSLQDFFILLF